jgi:putative spermidine/putrescine transport system substrate-binding protein
MRFDRRRVLKGAAAATVPFLPVHRVRAAKTIKVGAYGGFFKDSFDANIFPDFTAATGIAIESVAEPTVEAWLVQLDAAIKAGQPTADVSMIALGGYLRSGAADLWVPIDLAAVPNATNLEPHFIHYAADGATVDGIGAVAWYTTLVSNTEEVLVEPTSWAEMWDPKYADSLGLLALASNAFLLEVAAVTFFGGRDKLATQEGCLDLLAKVAELKPNTRLWYRDEGQFQQALQAGEVIMGQHYHDVTLLMADDGIPVRSTFPKEGGILDSGAWAITKGSQVVEEAHVFIDYMSRPDIQAKVARNVGTVPTAKRDLLDLTDEEFARVSSTVPPLIPEYRIYSEWTDWIEEKWAEMITAG